MCPHCLGIDGKFVDTEPHLNLGHKLVLTQMGGGEERYVCTACHTRWRRKIPNGASSAPYYRWMAIS